MGILLQRKGAIGNSYYSMLSMWISPFPEPSKDKKISRLEPTSVHALPTHSVTRALLSEALIFPLVYRCKFYSRCFSNCCLVTSLNGLLKETWRSWTRLVQPGRTLTNSVLFLLSRDLAPSASCDRCTSATKTFPVEPVVWGFIKMFPHCSNIHFFISDPSHQAFGWNATCTLRSHSALCSIYWSNRYRRTKKCSRRYVGDRRWHWNAMQVPYLRR